MEKASKGVAWICIFSTLLMGCYTSTLIDTKGEARTRIYSETIIDVLTKEGRKYVFETPPIIRNDTLIGEATVDYGYLVKRDVAIPMVEVSYVSVNENKTLTVMGLVVLVGLVGLVVFCLAMGDYRGPLL